MAILHITFNLSTQGSIKHAIRQHQLQRTESVICIHDMFSIGPLTTLEERKSWLEKHIFRSQEDQDLYEDVYQVWKKAIANVPCNVDVWVWYSQNAYEEIALRYVMSEFIHKCSRIYGVDATEGLERLQSKMSIRHTGELSSAMLMKLRQEARRFSVQECQQLANEWATLIQTPNTLRLWQQGITHVEENAFDATILACAKSTHEQSQEEWLSPTRIMGNVYSEIEDYLSEEYLENRLLFLAEQGHFEIDGDVTDSMTYQLKYIEK
ncbi:DUF1835 domain-containing protein [Lysinibacillus piscis]|uniref:DUF1835 domain-containing protein n=1 Tax=Lysinibacillus piscis TaxID=2518931 RepID=A0ABQ5NF06_9BACI|nr:DUF1835 domain-containing protein [Lysinibacillus sp. KH24]GLC86882.1 hypothetical protein LYSBPC_00090 [Lysinibacillus sp. KH24]